MQNLVQAHSLEANIFVDSAGTSAHHVGEAADPRSQACANRHGVELRSKSRQFKYNDFAKFDYIVAMDTSNRSALWILAQSDEDQSKIYLLRDFDNLSPNDASVPDPYYGGSGGFEEVFELCARSCAGLLEAVQKT